MEGLLREVCSRVSLKIQPENGSKVLDFLNDFERTQTGDFILPNLLAGEPLDTVMKVLLPGGAIGQSTLFKLSLRWTQQGNIDRESTRKECSIIYAASNDTKIQSVNPEVQKALQLLEAARIKQQAMKYIDEGDLQLALYSLSTFSVPLKTLADSTGDADLQVEVQELHGFLRNLEERSNLAKARKSMTYQSAIVFQKIIFIWHDVSVPEQIIEFLPSYSPGLYRRQGGRDHESTIQ